MNRRNLIAAAAVTPLAALPVRGDAAAVENVIQLHYAEFPVVDGRLQVSGVVYDPAARLFAMTVEREYVSFPIHRLSREYETETLQDIINYWNYDYLTWAGDDHKVLTLYWLA